LKINNFEKSFVMKKVVAILMIVGFIISCNSTKRTVTDSTIVKSKTSDTVRIANDEIEYEVIIIDPGFNSFLYGQARPRGYYSESFLEQRNRLYVMEWNSRVRQPSRFNPNLYEMQIDYDSSIHYGYEVNYLIYNYFIYFQIQYKQQLAGFVPRI
jgi:hypothetical protein